MASLARMSARRIRLAIPAAVVLTALTAALAAASVPPSVRAPAAELAQLGEGPSTGAVARMGRTLPDTSRSFVLRREALRPLEDVPGVASLSPHFGINDPGQTVGAYDDPAGPRHGFLRHERDLLDKGAYKTIDPAGMSGTVASDVNDRGQILLPAPGSLFLSRSS
jgi:hypothetical protein